MEFNTLCYGLTFIFACRWLGYKVVAPYICPRCKLSEIEAKEKLWDKLQLNPDVPESRYKKKESIELDDLLSEAANILNKK